MLQTRPLSLLQLLIKHFPAHHWLWLPKNLGYTLTRSLFNSPSIFFIYCVFSFNALNSLTRIVKEKGYDVMYVLEQKLHFLMFW